MRLAASFPQFMWGCGVVAGRRLQFDLPLPLLRRQLSKSGPAAWQLGCMFAAKPGMHAPVKFQCLFLPCHSDTPEGCRTNRTSCPPPARLP